jgi:hypothetical protein
MTREPDKALWPRLNRLSPQLPLRKLVLETPFDLFATQLSCAFAQQNRINDFVAFDLSGDQRGVQESQLFTFVSDS